MTDLFEHEIAETHLFNIKKRVKSKHNKKKRHINNFFKIDSSVTFGSYCHVPPIAHCVRKIGAFGSLGNLLITKVCVVFFL